MIPIVPGIMPISNYEQLIRFSGTCGAEVPRWLQYLLKDVQDDPIALQELGLDVVTALCERLIAGGAPGLHFYSLNQSKLLLELGRRLGLLKNLAG
jgi:methylenetetrahydrofolate reductase (NADPH)